MADLTPEFLTGLSDGALADFYYHAIDHDPDGDDQWTKEIEAEIERRGLSRTRLDEEWHKLAAQTAADPLMGG